MEYTNWEKWISSVYNNNEPEKDYFDHIKEEAKDNRMTDADAWVAWRIGLAAWKAARMIGAKFPNDNF